MENVCHPLCACGLPVMVHEFLSPCYDDGGSVDSIHVDIEYYDVCDMCYISPWALEPRPSIVIEPDKDDLPF